MQARPTSAAPRLALNLIFQTLGSGSFGVGCQKRCWVYKLSNKHAVSREEKEEESARGRGGTYCSVIPHSRGSH